jgi:hypothetical protein
MTKIHDITDHPPHLCIAESDVPHVIPTALVRSVIMREKPSAVPTDASAAQAIEGWLEVTHA